MVGVLYADTSVLAGAYFADEIDHRQARTLLFGDDDVVVTSELTHVELTSAVRAADRDGRLADATGLLQRIDADCGPDGPITLIALSAETVLPAARRLLSEHPLRTLDAIHLAVAHAEADQEHESPFAFVSRDTRQRDAARKLGLRLR